MDLRRIENPPNRWKGFVLGIGGGIAGLLAMGIYWQAVTALTGQDPRKAENQTGLHNLDDIAVIGTHHQPDESSTAAMGRLLVVAVTGRAPSAATKALLSEQIHWGYGTLLAGLYGALRAGAAPDAGGGLGYGSGLWLVGSELAVPLLGLAAGPTTQPLASHAHALGAHLTYGLITAGTTQILYRLF